MKHVNIQNDDFSLIMFAMLYAVNQDHIDIKISSLVLKPLHLDIFWINNV